MEGQGKDRRKEKDTGRVEGQGEKRGEEGEGERGRRGQG